MTPNRLTPGVYVAEGAADPRTIAGVATGVTALIGAARRGPCNFPVPIGSVDDFERRFGGLAADLELGYAVRQFFLNGGSAGWAVRVPRRADTHQWLQGLNSLAAVDHFNLLVLPGLADPDVLAAAADTCRQRRAFLIVDAPADARTPERMAQRVCSGALPRTSFGAVYFPWVRIADPLNPGAPRSAPPGATMAGLFARTDDHAGIWRAPAGPDALLEGVAGLDRAVGDREGDALAELGVNCLRTFPHGTVAWGERTMEGGARLNSDWRYVPVRRLALFLEENLDQGTQWVASEPNGPALWAALRASVGAFMRGLFRRGAFLGAKPSEAYFVKCDEATTTPDDIAAGEVSIEVGFAALRPADFVVVTVRQLTAPPACLAGPAAERLTGEDSSRSGGAGPGRLRSRGLRQRRVASA